MSWACGDVADEKDSLAPIVEAAAGSTRVRAWALLIGKWLLVAAVLPMFHLITTWIATRYDIASAARLQEKADALETEVGLPPKGIQDEKLRDRVAKLELENNLRMQKQLSHDHDFYARLVAVAASAGERDGRRKDLARAALREFEDACLCRGTVGDAFDPYRCRVDPGDVA